MFSFSQLAFTSALLTVATIADSDLAFGYESNGEDWASLHDGEWALCDSGSEQSPIDLKSKAPKSDNIEIMGFNFFDFAITDQGEHTAKNAFKFSMPSPQLENARIELTKEDESKEKFTPLQFHFHAPSEHTVDGKHHDLEIHIVHKKEGTGVANKPIEYGAVIGVFFDVSEGGDKKNPFIESIFKGLDLAGNSDAEDDSSVALRSLLNEVDFTEFWSYPGSFTTPPCTEGINWNVIKKVQPISKAQLEKFTELWAGDETWAAGNGNNREIQDSNGRTVKMTQVDGASSLLAGVATALAAIAAFSF